MIPIFSGKDPALYVFLTQALAGIPKVRAIDWDDTILLSRTALRDRKVRTHFFGTPTEQFLKECPYLIQTWTFPPSFVAQFFEKHPELPAPICVIWPLGFPDCKDLSLLPLPPGSEVVDDLPEEEFWLPPGAVFRRVTTEE